MTAETTGENAFGVAPAAWAKFDAPLRRAVETDGTEAEWPVMVVLTGAAEAAPPGEQGRPDKGARRAWAAEQKAAFEREAAGVVLVLERAGAYAIERHWLNRSVSARAPLAALEAAGARDDVNGVVLAATQRVIPE